jgi:nucleotide-binding universal stress UspA family protein
MFGKILVPLDGSKLAEAALPAAFSLSQKLNAPITLLHVIEQDAPREVHREHHITGADEARAYLRAAAKRASPGKTKVDWHVHTAAVKDVARSITEHALIEFQPDLIVMCTHGRSGIGDLLFGNIAQQIVALGTTPLLLIKPGAPEPGAFKLRTIIVPLDSGPVHDHSLPAAQSLARVYEAEIHLVTVIPTLKSLAGEEAAAGNLLPATTSALLELKADDAQADLQGHLDDLHRAGVRATAEVARGDPATMILTIAKQISADLIVLSTHRKTGLAAFWARSVAPKVANRSSIPLLLIPLS